MMSDKHYLRIQLFFVSALVQRFWMGGGLLIQGEVAFI